MDKDSNAYEQILAHPCEFDRNALFTEPTTESEYTYKIENGYCELYKSIFEREVKMLRCINPPHRCNPIRHSHPTHLHESRVLHMVKQAERDYKNTFGYEYYKMSASARAKYLNTTVRPISYDNGNK